MSARSSGADSRPEEGERVHVIGGCHVGRYVASQLTALGNTVHLHDSAPLDDPPGTLAVHEVDSFDSATLVDAGLDEDTTLLAVNPSDSTNFLLAQIARTVYDVDRVVALVNDPRRAPAFEDAGIETVDATAVLGHAILERP